MREEFLNLLRSVNRDGMSDLLDFIENKYIPLIMVSIGIGLNIWINK